jgi:hypothetical protein
MWTVKRSIRNGMHVGIIIAYIPRAHFMVRMQFFYLFIVWARMHGKYSPITYNIILPARPVTCQPLARVLGVVELVLALVVM